ncbi:hypothetical protein PHYBLDRAFT_80362 [Phycomyces blakesleeanus NRRL 1555(-)]|uniref:Uncharacterized protein n=1 Tax=Phycomyces blakesleeanus (strain ATCC 8743b / DSM 1359 / FGSC 10004 / NBRC 33097 / NRRL 1555) TaxID=763407 RepID=A0A162NH60_PHYB8|nr:hypothetical protein PHYBLDRAFT_80362 [Phycomyces blakesleeanus NRRL 1555(-)]OAD74228.1 hypothetical protein PHYBLDRAFT_80362 [Phycomyces blakesleeanus NRRL 1555(-)]|eukprot:XP_018292268.1 hypothetical protein PHYBLDRAFT_80362 [Phycomyces blakesleeanus NRRL 1555(-)]
MPGARELKTDEINSYTEPLVYELVQLYHRIRMPTFGFLVGEVICAALMVVAYDIPVARKTSEFTAHNSTCVFFKYTRHFTRLADTIQVDFCGFNESRWCRVALRRIGYMLRIDDMIVPNGHTVLRSKFDKKFADMKAAE